jgi:hypothetical protein
VLRTSGQSRSESADRPVLWGPLAMQGMEKGEEGGEEGGEGGGEGGGEEGERKGERKSLVPKYPRCTRLFRNHSIKPEMRTKHATEGWLEEQVQVQVVLECCRVRHCLNERVGNLCGALAGRTQPAVEEDVPLGHGVGEVIHDQEPVFVVDLACEHDTLFIEDVVGAAGFVRSSAPLQHTPIGV